MKELESLRCILRMIETLDRPRCGARWRAAALTAQLAHSTIEIDCRRLYALQGICHRWYISGMLTTFEVLAQPIRRSILDRLRGGEHLVGELADAIGLTQPLTSKHLRVLRDAGFVTVRVDGPAAGTACASSRSSNSTTG